MGGYCNELNAAYAADGYARMNGISGLVVTHGVGAWSAINGVAGAYSEHVPVICVCGSVPLKALDRKLRMHHTSGEPEYDDVLRGYAQVTAAQARLTPQNAVREIDRLILTAWQRKLPVYLELSSDIAHLDVEVPAEPLVPAMPKSDPERLTACADAIIARLTNARSPAILLDLDADRFQVTGELLELAAKLKAPIAAMNTCKGIVDYTIERTTCGKDGRFNDIANWAYADLPKVLHPGTNARTAVVRTPDELKEALASPHDSMLFIEAVMDKYDAPPTAVESGHRMADIDYGPRGPQHRPGVQI